MKYTIDRLEGGFAVAQDDNGRRVNLDINALPDGIKEGDVIEKTSGGYFVCTNETEKLRSDNAETLKKLLARGKM